MRWLTYEPKLEADAASRDLCSQARKPPGTLTFSLDNGLIIIREAAAAAKFDAHFERMWDAGQPMVEFAPAVNAYLRLNDPEIGA
jgi:hypothetical protein